MEHYVLKAMRCSQSYSVLFLLPCVRYGKTRHRSREKDQKNLKDFLLPQFPGERVSGRGHHALQGQMGKTTGSVSRQREQVELRKCLYCDFCGKHASWGRSTPERDWLAIFESGVPTTGVRIIQEEQTTYTNYRCLSIDVNRCKASIYRS